MDFMGIGLQEIGLILLVLFIFVGPTRLPEIARQMGKLSRKLREATRELSQELESIADEAKEAEKGINRVKNPKSALKKDLRSISEDILGMGKEVRSTMDSAKEMGKSPSRVAALRCVVKMPAGLTEQQRQKLENFARHCPVHVSLASEMDRPIEFIYPD